MARSHGDRCDGDNCKGHPFNCYGHPTDCACTEAPATMTVPKEAITDFMATVKAGTDRAILEAAHELSAALAKALPQEGKTK